MGLGPMTSSLKGRRRRETTKADERRESFGSDDELTRRTDQTVRQNSTYDATVAKAPRE